MEKIPVEVKKASLLQGSLLGFIGLAVHQLVGFVFVLLLARTLPVEDFGTYRLALTILSMTGMTALLGMNWGIAHFTAQQLGKGTEHYIRHNFLKITLLFFLWAIIVSSGLYRYSGLIANVFDNAKLQDILRYLAIALPFFLLSKIANGVLLGYRHMFAYMLAENILWKLFPLTIVIGFLLLRKPVDLAIVSFSLVAAAVGMCVFSFVYASKLAHLFWPGRPKRDYVGKILRYSLPLSVVNIVNIITNRFDIIVLGYFLTSRDIGLYNAALQLSSIMLILLHSVATVFMSTVAYEYVDNETEHISAMFAIVKKWLFLLTLPVFVFILLFGQDIMIVVFRKQYAYAGYAFIILAAGHFIDAVVGPTGATLMGLGKTKANMHINNISGLLNIVLLLLVVPRLGITGAALTCSITSFVKQLSLLYVVNKAIRVKFISQKQCMFFLYMVVVYLVVKFFNINTIQTLFTLTTNGVIFGMLVIFGLLLTKQIEEQEKKYLVKIGKKFRLQ